MYFALLLIKANTKQNKWKQNSELLKMPGQIPQELSCFSAGPFLTRLLPQGASATKFHKLLPVIHLYPF